MLVRCPHLGEISAPMSGDLRKCAKEERGYIEGELHWLRTGEKVLLAQSEWRNRADRLEARLARLIHTGPESGLADVA